VGIVLNLRRSTRLAQRHICRSVPFQDVSVVCPVTEVRLKLTWDVNISEGTGRGLGDDMW
jgi:hypothetical protein